MASRIIELSTKLQPRECFGTIVTTPTVAAEIGPKTLAVLLDRHFTNDWGDLDDEDAQMNSDAVNACDGSRIMSRYNIPTGEKVWIISYLHSDPKHQQNPDVCNTCVMFPSEY